uniref:Uncharacterized protein n=1 Tax=Dechloromonas aromatica (strain RCB) TaxID=159087 RepID=Q47HY4_DECAR
MSVTTWSNMPDSVDDRIGIPSNPQPGEVNNRVIGGTVSLVQGQQATEFSTYRASESDLAPSSEKGMMGTVRNNGGFITTNVTPNSTIEIPGFGRTSVKVAESLGYLTRTGDGRYVETSRLGKDEGSSEGGTLEESKGTPNDAPDNGAELFGSGFEAEYGELIKDVPQGVYDSLLASANVHIGEGLDLGSISEKLAPRLASSMGIEPKAAAAMLDEGSMIWQAQADIAVERHGADPDDFYQWARDNRKNELQQAVNGHLFQRSTKGYTTLVNDYFDNTIPTVAALKAGGIPVTEKGGEVMVKLKGHWMSVGAAVKARLV